MKFHVNLLSFKTKNYICNISLEIHLASSGKRYLYLFYKVDSSKIFIVDVWQGSEYATLLMISGF